MCSTHLSSPLRIARRLGAIVARPCLARSRFSTASSACSFSRRSAERSSIFAIIVCILLMSCRRGGTSRDQTGGEGMRKGRLHLARELPRRTQKESGRHPKASEGIRKESEGRNQKGSSSASCS